MTKDDLIPIVGLTPELMNEVARLQVPPDFLVPVGRALAESQAYSMFGSLEAFACLRIGYVLACAMIKRQSKAA